MSGSAANNLTGRPLRVLALTRKLESASFERRVTDYAGPLAERGIELTWRYVPKDRAGRRKLQAELGGFDVVWWHRYLVPPVVSRGYRKAARRIIFDFDDPIIYSTHGGGRRPNLSRRIKFARWLRKCDAAMAGNEYLASHARPYCPNVHVVPMAVDIPPEVPSRRAEPGRAELLWLGGRATMRFLQPLAGALDRAAELRPGVTMRLVAHEPLDCRTLRVDFRKWSPTEQDGSLAECDIGLCPMPDSPWTRGKCPYKVLQYMAAGMAWVGSAVGENIATAGGGQRGLTATTDAEWTDAIVRLADDVELRRRMGTLAREYVELNHGRAALADRLADIFRRTAGA